MAIIMFGVSLFTYWYFIDEHIHPPMDFYVDIENFETDKAVYEQQEIVKIKTSFCKTRTSIGTVSWNLVDTYIRSYQTKSGQLKKGCYGIENDLWLDVEQLPPELPAGEYYFEAVGYIEINPIKSVKYNYKTETFRVVK